MSNLQAYQGGWSLTVYLDSFDADGDRILDVVEDAWAARAPGSLNKHLFADAVADFDNDGVMNFEEVALGLHLLQASTVRADGLNDAQVLAWALLRGNYERSVNPQRAAWESLTLEQVWRYVPEWSPDWMSSSGFGSWLDQNDSDEDDEADGWTAFRAQFTPSPPQRVNAADADGDGMSDVWEHRHRLDPRSTRDGGSAALLYNAANLPVMPGFAEFAAGWEDQQHVSDAYQWSQQLHARQLADWQKIDPDGDTLSNLKEFQLGTNPRENGVRGKRGQCATA